MTSPLAEYRFDRFEVRPAQRQVLVGGAPAALGARAFDVLVALLERRERVVSKSELLDVAWPGVVVEENNLQVQIWALRKLFGSGTIATLPGRGYRFTAELEGASVVKVADRCGEPRPATDSPGAPGNVPRQIPSLVGRDAELDALIRLVELKQLVTVVGTSGMGKTTLATAAASRLRERWTDGAWIVELAAISDPLQVPQAVAHCLRITLSGPGTPRDQLAGVLQSQSLLLVLDNCERVVGGVCSLVEAVIANAPGVRILATSQKLLNVPTEQLYKLGPLAVPGSEEVAAEHFGALRLFSERAQAIDPHFTLSSSNVELVAEICRELDGLPLAIELAAARVRLLGVAGIRNRLGERFRVLKGGARAGPERHQALQTAIDWSHELLSEEEKTVLRRLGVFVSGFTLELAQNVATDERLDEWAVLDALGGLADKSLVTADPGEPPRFRLLESTRAYALQKLEGAGETTSVVKRHARVICRLFCETEDARFGERGSLSLESFIQQLAPELDNLRAALSWAMSDPQRGAIAVALAGASAEVFRTIGLAQEGLAMLQTVQDRVDDENDPDGAALFWLRLPMLGENGRLTRSTMMDAAARAQRIYRARGARRRLYFVMYMTAWTLGNFGDYAAGEALLPEIVTLEDPKWPGWVRSFRLHLQVGFCMRQERFEEALGFAAEEQALLEREPGEEARLLSCLASHCIGMLGLERDEEVVPLARLTVERSRKSMASPARPFLYLTAALTFLGRTPEAQETMRNAMGSWRRDGLLTYFGWVPALLLAELGRLQDAARVDGAAYAFVERTGIASYPVFRRAKILLQERFRSARLKKADIERWRAEGGQLNEAELARICLGKG